MSFKYITKEDKSKELFYKIPKQFMLEKKYKKMKDSAKILYSILYERTNLSIKNNWFDDKDRAYIICSFDEIQVFFGCSRDKVNSALKDLEKFDLIKKEKIMNRDGDNINVLYVAHVETTSDTLDSLLEKHKDTYQVLRNKKREYKKEYNKKQSEIKKAKRESLKIVESENQTTIERTKVQRIKTLKSSNTNGSLKIRLRGVRKSDYSKTDFSKTDLVVVVLSIKDIQKDSSKSTNQKLLEISKQLYMSDKTKALVYKFIENNILLSERQISMLGKMEYKVCEIALDLTIAQDGHTFSYFYKIYKTEEQKSINEFIDDFYVDTKDTFVQKEEGNSKESPVDNLDEVEKKTINVTDDFEKSFYQRALKQEWRVTKPTYQMAKKYAEKNSLFCPAITEFI